MGEKETGAGMAESERGAKASGGHAGEEQRAPGDPIPDLDVSREAGGGGAAPPSSETTIIKSKSNITNN